MRGHLTIKIQTSDEEKLNYLVMLMTDLHPRQNREPSSVCVPSRLREFFCWSLELLIQRMEMDPKRFESVLEPLPEGDRKTRIREALLSNIEGEQDLKQIVLGATRAGYNIVELFQQPPLNLQLYDASALAGVVLPAKGKYFSSSVFFLGI
jgi:hypothetical protein